LNNELEGFPDGLSSIIMAEEVYVVPQLFGPLLFSYSRFATGKKTAQYITDGRLLS
jgi:hypothetical protein